jgi:inosine triphosphate pyrophosphatase
MIYIVTGNKNKLNEMKIILKTTIEIDSLNLDIPEIQGEPYDIIIEKAKYIANKTQKKIIVEDTSLCFNALGGLPGPYIKSFMDKIGSNGLYRMMGSYEDKTCYALCLIAYCEPDGEPIIFEGKCDGVIVEPYYDANGNNPGFGWDNIFCPKNYDKTFAELYNDVKNKISHRYFALQKLGDFFEHHQ